jgi:release factor glutamine methyltransferase
VPGSDRPDVVARLAAAGCVAAEDEAAALLAVASDGDALDALVRRREVGEPLAWITGRIEFCGRVLHVAQGVYVPRPHTEELARRAARALPRGGCAVDLCTGSGAIGATLAAGDAGARVVATDVDGRAAACARRNGVDAVVTNLADAIGGDGTWDVVTAVAPYVPTDAIRFLPADVQTYEPRAALDGGADGLEAVAAVVDAARRLLRAEGCLLTEIGGGQAEPMRGLLAGAGFDPVEVWTDEDDDVRGVVARRQR